MTDRYGDLSSNLTSPVSGGFAVTPSDSAALPEATRAIYVGSGGSLAVQMLWGATLTFDNVQSGSVLPLRVTKILAASTATAIVGLY